MTKLLLSLLTSSKLDYLIEAYDCILNQSNHTLDHDILIMINTLNDEYYEKVIDYFENKKPDNLIIERDNLIIERSESNGKPGKGHNSVIEYFKNNDSYDYILMFDGDDFTYPCTLNRIEQYLHYNPDALLLPFNDILNPKLNESCGIPINNNVYYTFNNISDNIIHQWCTDKLSPFKNHINNVNTPGRLILLSRNALNINISYDENMGLYDDLIVFMQLFETSLYKKEYNIFMVHDCDIMIYNRLNDESATEKLQNKIIDIESENNILINSIKNNFYLIRDWDLRKMIFLSNTTNDIFSIVDKVKYVNKLVDRLDYDNEDIFSNCNINMDPFMKYAIINNNQELFNEYDIRRLKYLNNLIIIIYNKDDFINFVNKYTEYNTNNNYDILMFCEQKDVTYIQDVINNNKISLIIEIVDDINIINKFKISNIFDLKILNNYNYFLYIDISKIDLIQLFEHILNKNIFNEILDDTFYVSPYVNIDNDSICNENDNDYISNDTVILFKNSYYVRKILLMMYSLLQKNNISFYEIFNLLIIKNQIYDKELICKYTNKN